LVKNGSSGRIASSAHLHLAQLSDNPRLALDHYQNAVDILYSQVRNKYATSIDEASAEDVLRRQTIAKALVAMTEIWLTDLWYASFKQFYLFGVLRFYSMEEDAENNCETLLNLALQADPENSEVLQSIASVRMSQQRPEEARTYVEQAWGLWKDLSTGWLAHRQMHYGLLIVTCR
jgi:hypothetical protein